MFALKHVQVAALFSAALFAGCSSETQTESGKPDEGAVAQFLSQQNHQVGSINADGKGAYDFSVGFKTGNLIVNIGATDGSGLTAPFSFHPGDMDAYLGRAIDYKLTEVPASNAAQWIFSDDNSSLCGVRKLAGTSHVTLADGSEKEVAVGLSWLPANTPYAVDLSTGGCPSPAGGAAGCNGKECKFVVGALGAEVTVYGKCYYGEEIWGTVRTCFCDVITPDTEADDIEDIETGTGDTTKPLEPLDPRLPGTL